MAQRQRTFFAAACTVTAIGASFGSTSLHAQTEYPWSEISFLSGCWSGTMGTLDMREQWTEAEAGVMLGTTRYFRDGSLVDFEFAMIGLFDRHVALWPYPSGERSPRSFPLVRTENEELVFENLEHDFPVRIIYAREGADAIAPRIEGRDGETREWSLKRVPCPG